MLSLARVAATGYGASVALALCASIACVADATHFSFLDTEPISEGWVPSAARGAHLNVNITHDDVWQLNDHEIRWLAGHPAYGPGGLGLPMHTGGSVGAHGGMQSPDDDGGPTLSGDSTHYAFPSGGNSCNLDKHTDCHCVAPSDESPLWQKVMQIPQACWMPKGDDTTSGAAMDWLQVAMPDDPCSGCHGAPDCNYWGKQGGNGLCAGGKVNNGGQMCVACMDGSNCKQGVGKFVEVKIADACPHNHPCNTCKGDKNPCAAAQGNHLDMCDPTFNYLYYKQSTWHGPPVKVSMNLALCGEPSNKEWTDGCKGL